MPPVTRRPPVAITQDLEPLAARPCDILDNVIGSGTFSPEHRRRLESFARRYSKGKPLFIQTATLRGPFGEYWQPPWDKQTYPGLSSSSTIPPIGNQESGRVKSNNIPPKPSRPQPSIAHHDEPTRQGQAVQELQQSSLPTPSDSGDDRSVQISEQGTPSKNPRGTPYDNTYSPSNKSPVDAHDTLSLKPTNLPETHDVDPNVPGPTLSKNTENISRFIASTYGPGQKRATRDRLCDHCGTRDTSVWCKGPAGPRTLCASCAGKWVHEVNKKKKAAASEQRTIPARDLETAAATVAGQRPSKKQRIEKTSADSVLESTLVTPLAVRSMDPKTAALHSKIMQRIFPRSLQELELLLPKRGDALELRGRASPAIKRWSATHQLPSSTQLPEFEYRRVVSPRKPRYSRRKTQADSQGSEYEPEAKSKSTSKVKRTITSNTPVVSHTPKSHNDTTRKRSDGSDYMTSKISPNHVVPPMQPESPLLSTQAALQQAHDSFQNGLVSPTKLATPQETSTDSETFSGKLSFDELLDAAGAPVSTQELFEAAPTFSSTVKKPSSRKRASFAASIEQETPIGSSRISKASALRLRQPSRLSNSWTPINGRPMSHSSMNSEDLDSFVEDAHSFLGTWRIDGET